uniref:Serine/threonine-protein phosphatase n=1 Tax=Chromera velia CCMP2878 TaxID=1169474 RepID=A0A0K6SBC8_9ALVE|eukprot:Cvel_13260.t1-p1 / transcript=Cvel_13260.t1 / gene=Cvel_13260 / organism=Chromera_velia_CCMP2878 / gene_product=Serine/threonine-protein phosphatase 2B catalytic, putative / transcript_product=Serine/threonine-protein phosphatase 2B catalytic, putative / location=Cvel_scaffold899:25794-32833(-) / protein_length=524 / sequence_SO=supercontig / SO=protein_coding / is_pseudo=false
MSADKIPQMPPMPDPRGDRVVKDFDGPPVEFLSDQLLYPGGSPSPDWKVLRQHLIREGRLSQQQVLLLLKKATDVVQSEPNMIRVKDPVTVVGDIHGQFYDLVRLLELGGDPDEAQYIFLGDYVDRGSYSIEVVLLIIAIKLNRPKNIYMLRGNHECRQMTAYFNFKDECEHKYDEDVYCAFMEFFDCLPVSALVNGKFLGLHGGLSPELVKPADIANVNRFQEPPKSGLLCDMLWSDPVDEEKEDKVKAAGKELFVPNDARGCSFFFGFDAAKGFLDKNSLLSVIRAHEAQLEGYKMHTVNTKTGFPTVITIFSAPNYCDCYNNKGAVLKFENNTLNIQQFNFSPHPYHLPNFMDVFMWSLPFVSEKVVEMLYHIMQPAAASDDDADDVVLPVEITSQMGKMIAPSGPLNKSGIEPDTEESLAEKMRKRKEELRNKVKTVSRMMKMFKTLRQENELIVQLKGQTPGHRIPMGALIEGRRGLESEMDLFNNLKKVDVKNEGRPEGFEGPATPTRRGQQGLGVKK